MPSSTRSANTDWSASGRDIWTVSRLNREIRVLLDNAFGLLWVEGELSNVARPASGHFYFTLKDRGAQVRCAMFRQRNRNLDFSPAAGDLVLVRARAGLYEPRGDYQLIVEHMEPSGEGALRAAFEALKARLAAEGLFDADLKRPIPPLPRRIGIITSPTGAAVRDIINVLRRRFAAIPVLIYPVPVQGDTSAGEIAAMLKLAGQRADCDVLILARGGGSLEDLQSFNDERVARAIRACPLPVICGVGHETDVTIADFAADLRAPTPSAAAEQAVPDSTAHERRIVNLRERLMRLVKRRMQHAAERADSLLGRLSRQHPGQRLRERAQRLDELEQRIHNAWRRALAARRERLRTLQAQLARYSPAAEIARAGDAVHAFRLRLAAAMRQRLDAGQSRLAVAARALDAVSPLATLSRGYAIVSTTSADGERRVVHDVTAIEAGDRIEARVAHGHLDAIVEQIHPDTGKKPDNL